MTPSERWFGTYHVKEPFAADLLKSYQALNIPADQIFALDKALTAKELEGRMPGHGSGIKNPAYRPVWLKMLGSGRDVPRDAAVP